MILMTRRELAQGALLGFVGGVFGNMWMSSFFVAMNGYLDDATMTRVSTVISILFLIGFIIIVAVLWKASRS